MAADHYAIVVGIDAYAGFRPLKAARADAALFTEWLLDPNGGGLPEANVYPIRVRPPGDKPFDARPILQDILEALIAMRVAEYRKIGQRLYFYFAGHGVGPQFNDVAMLFATAHEGLFTNLGLIETMKFFDEAAVFDEIVMILDCCRAQKAAVPSGLGFNAPNAENRPHTSQFVLLGAPHRGVAFEAFDDLAGARRGLLTKAVLEGLSGAPQAVNTQRQVTSASLAGYVATRVAELAGLAGSEQRVEAPYRPATDMVFRTLPAPTATFQLTILRGPQSTALAILVVGGPDLQQIHREPAGAAPVVLNLPIHSTYMVMLEGGLTSVVTDTHVVNGAARVDFA